MKLSEFIKELNKVWHECGDIEISLQDGNEVYVAPILDVETELVIITPSDILSDIEWEEE